MKKRKWILKVTVVITEIMQPAIRIGAETEMACAQIVAADSLVRRSGAIAISRYEVRYEVRRQYYLQQAMINFFILTANH